MSFDNRSSAVEGSSSSNPEMQTLCKTGCGFYGNPVQEGLCSKCHKDKVKHLQQNLPPSNSSSTACVVNSTVQSEARFLRNSSPLLVSSKHESSSGASGGAVSPHRETSEDQQKTPEPAIEQASPELHTAATNNAIISSTESTASTEPEANTAQPKKNRCLACNKRVGLTGFGCRCGGLFCSTHRYSDMHGCSFDYKEHAQGQIRKNNPVVMGSKITKI